MRYLLLSDIHANLHALEAVLADARALGYDEILVLGDLVGYGGDPGAALDRTLGLSPAAIIRGNHDKVCAGLEPATLFNDVARQSVEWTASVLSAAQTTALRALPKGPRVVAPDLEICHGAPFDEDCYLFDARDAARAIRAAGARLCFFGHTHVPAIFATNDNPVQAAPEVADDAVALPARGPVLINVGSVGQPRDGDPRAAYGLLDMEALILRMRRVEYDLPGAQQRIRDAGLPEWLAARLERGQ